MADEEVKESRDFIYIGRRAGENCPYVDCVVWLNPDRSQGTRAAYLFKKKRGWLVGGVYTGAKVTADGSSATGMSDAMFTGPWPDKVERLQWEAETSQIDQRLAAKKLREKYHSEMETQLLPLRQTYQRLLRADFTTAQALDQLVLAVLHKPLTAAEKE